MTAVVSPIMEPDRSTMLAHLEHLFGGFLDGFHEGLIELAWTDTEPNASGRYPLSRAKLFSTDQLEEIADEAARLNATPMCNVYVGAWLRKPGTAPFGRSCDADAWAMTAAYTDLDEAGATASVKDIYGPNKPTWITVTGREPHQRAQLWWRLKSPVTEHDRAKRLIQTMAHHLHGDMDIFNPGRVMRLAGSIAWPHKPGRVMEATARAPLQIAGAPTYSVEQLEKCFPWVETAGTMRAVATPTPPSTAPTHTTTTYSGSLSNLGKVHDGRERYMRDSILACLIQMVGENGRAPTAQELFDAAWPQYERNVDFARPGRGHEEFAEKCEQALKRFHQGKIKGVASVADAKGVWEKKQSGQESAVVEVIAANHRWVYPSREFVADFIPPDYLIHGVIQKGYIYSLTAATGTGKTAVLLMLATHVDRGAPIGGRKVKRGRVLYLAGENPNDVRMRWFAQTQQMALTPEDMSNTLFMPLVVPLSSGIERIRQEIGAGDIALVIVDTAAAYSEAADENANVDQRRQAQILRQLLSLPGGPAVIVACHPPKNADGDHLEPRGGGAFIAEIDGNLCLRKSDGALEFHHTDKFRGTEFPPLHFRLETVTHERLVDGDGNKILTVVAKYVGDIERGEMKENAILDQDLMLMAIDQYPTESTRERAKAQGWIYKTGEPNHKRVQVAIRGLLHYGLIKQDRRGYLLTEKGQKECKKLRLQTAPK